MYQVRRVRSFLLSVREGSVIAVTVVPILPPPCFLSAKVGIIPVLASLLGSAVREMAADTHSNCIPGGGERLTELQVGFRGQLGR